LCLTLLLLDKKKSFDEIPGGVLPCFLERRNELGLELEEVSKPQVKSYKPTARELDPSALVAHKTIRNWKGFDVTDPLYASSRMACELFKKVDDARSNMIYRPFLYDKFWEECTLSSLIDSIPSPIDVEKAYKDFWQQIVGKIEEHQYTSDGKTDTTLLAKNQRDPEFVEGVFSTYKDVRSGFNTETVLCSYARMLNNEDIVKEVQDYREELLRTAANAG
jgi:hypothetical protein